ncbi:hypothetical protein [Variovorax sp. ZT5P30]
MREQKAINAMSPTELADRAAVEEAVLTALENVFPPGETGMAAETAAGSKDTCKGTLQGISDALTAREEEKMLEELTPKRP